MRVQPTESNMPTWIIDGCFNRKEILFASPYVVLASSSLVSTNLSAYSLNANLILRWGASVILDGLAECVAIPPRNRIDGIELESLK